MYVYLYICFAKSKAILNKDDSIIKNKCKGISTQKSSSDLILNKADGFGLNGRMEEYHLNILAV